MNLKNILYVGLVTVVILLIPLVAMQFTDEVDWKLLDFVVMGSLLFLTGTALSWIMRRAGKNRLLWAATVILLFLLIWVELAVGIIGTPFAGS